MTFDEVIKRADKILESANIKRDFPIEINSRLRTTLGRVTVRLVNGSATITKMEFSKHILAYENEQELNDTIAHECAHVACAIYDGAKHGHDVYWKKWAIKFGANPNAHCQDKEYGQYLRKVGAVSDYKYFVVCGCCGQIVAKRKVKSDLIKNLGRYKSACCDATLKLCKKEL